MYCLSNFGILRKTRFSIGDSAISILFLIYFIALTLTLVIPGAVAQSYITYNDPNGKFSISYPASWSIRNITADPVVNQTLFYSSSSPNVANITAVVLRYTDLRNIPHPSNVNVTALSSILNKTILSIGEHPMLTQQLDCSTYTIVGSPACSAILQTTLTMGGSLGVRAQIMFLVSDVNGTVYYFGAEATRPNFSHILPIFFHMLSSFKPATS